MASLIVTKEWEMHLSRFSRGAHGNEKRRNRLPLWQFHFVLFLLHSIYLEQNLHFPRGRFPKGRYNFLLYYKHDSYTYCVEFDYPCQRMKESISRTSSLFLRKSYFFCNKYRYIIHETTQKYNSQSAQFFKKCDDFVRQCVYFAIFFIDSYSFSIKSAMTPSLQEQRQRSATFLTSSWALDGQTATSAAINMGRSFS